MGLDGLPHAHGVLGVLALEGIVHEVLVDQHLGVVVALLGKLIAATDLGVEVGDVVPGLVDAGGHGGQAGGLGVKQRVGEGQAKPSGDWAGSTASLISGWQAEGGWARRAGVAPSSIPQLGAPQHRQMLAPRPPRPFVEIDSLASFRGLNAAH